ncbi:prostaglandin F2-alpha receptor-like [Betta splendens]|uniref:Prostaglandin F2-alpha receptor-like n=1 Tax=Betta splendens TaxID=158456 RepID=A0A6P7N8H9_BETSP|nr:prostaglandin F2-alpha receptor-like [Betta splendens]
MTCLAVALVCNTISGLTLVLARLRRQPGSHHPAKSHDIEMVVQLVGIMITSCICWSPLLRDTREPNMTDLNQPNHQRTLQPMKY